MYTDILDPDLTSALLTEYRFPGTITRRIEFVSMYSAMQNDELANIYWRMFTMPKICKRFITFESLFAAMTELYNQRHLAS